MFAGVGKSGSPAPKPITFSPFAFSALALASTARVADSAMAARRADVRFTVEPFDRLCVAEPTCGPGGEPSHIFAGTGWPPPTSRGDWSGDAGPHHAGHSPRDAAERRPFRLRAVEDQARAGARPGQGQQQPAGQLPSAARSAKHPRSGSAPARA